MSEPTHLPLIDPTFFDLIVIGTGLPESMLAAGASAAGKSVLHIDPNPFYGSHYSSLTVQSLVHFIQRHQIIQSYSPRYTTETVNTNEYYIVDINLRPLYSDVEIYSRISEDVESSRAFCLDLCGPRLFFCADSVVDLLLRSGASHHVEFKSIDGSFIYIDGKLLAVPDSREAIFKDKNLGLTEKSQMMRFFKLVQGHPHESVEERMISEVDMEGSFVDFLKKQRLPPTIISIILYAIAMADYDQESSEGCNIFLTKDGIEGLSLYQASIGRFSNAVGAFIYPIYGQGELSQAFCRLAAVKGALYVLRMPVIAFLREKEGKYFKGVRLASGQDIFSNHVVTDPSISVPPPCISHSNFMGECVRSKELNKARKYPVEQVARSICLISGSVQKDLSNVLVVFPPRSLHAEQVTSVRALQLGSPASVCPPGMFVLYLSAICDTAVRGKKSVNAAIEALTVSESCGQDNASLREFSESEGKPFVLWCITYIQAVTDACSVDSIHSCLMPDGSLDYRDLLRSTTKNLQSRQSIQGEESWG